jgi:hypothetical protein
MLEIFETEYLAGSGDETYPRNDAKSAGGGEDGEDAYEESLDQDEDEAAPEPLNLTATADGEDPEISVFV